MSNDELIKHEDKIIIYLPIFKDLDYYQDLKTKVQPKTSNMLLKLQKAYRQIDFNLDKKYWDLLKSSESQIDFMRGPSVAFK